VAPRQQWYGETMLATIDGGGRVVVPKEIRDRLGLRPGTQVELTEIDGALEIAPAVTPMRVRMENGNVVLDCDLPMPTLTADQVRLIIDTSRR